jgi:predicted nuclease of predicted toxin-antitoxin system
VKFLVDAQLPPQLAGWLRAKGYEAMHVDDVGLRNSDDIDVRKFAEAQATIVVTKDRDFAAPPLIGLPPAVVWVRTGNAPTRVILERFEANWTQVEAYLAQGFALVEIR